MNKDELNYDRGVKSNLLPLYLKNVSVGNVHSKFNNGLNIQIGENLIYIGRFGAPLTAFGLNIDEEKLKHLLGSVRIGDLVVNKKDKLIVYGCEIITIYYSALEGMDLKLPEIKSRVQAIVDNPLYQYLNTIAFEQCLGIDVDEKTGKYVELLLNSDKTDEQVNADIIRFFVGRGKGLTPSGDDLLLGFTLALMLFGQFPAWKKVLVVEINSDKTTMISVAYVKALLAGYVSEHFIRLVKLIDGAEMDAVEKTIKEIRSFGHTSGNDTLFGFFLGLKYLVLRGTNV